MANPKFTSSYTGQNIENAIARALQLDTFEYQNTEVINEQAFHVLWKVKPTNENQVNGIAIHPVSGKLVNVISINGSISTCGYLTDGAEFINALSNLTFVIDGGTSETVIN